MVEFSHNKKLKIQEEKLMSVIKAILNPFRNINTKPETLTEGSSALAPVHEEVIPPVIAPAAESEVSVASVKDYFDAKGYTVDFSHNTPCNAHVEKLAYTFAVNYRAVKPFLKYIRESLTKKSERLNYSLTQYSDSDKEKIAAFAEILGDYGITANVFYNREKASISGKFSYAPRVINFINGDYLEIYARAVAEKVIKAAANAHCLDYEVYSNLIIEKDGQKNELDLVFRVGNCIFWSEVKSGKFSDFDHYRKLGDAIGLNPDRHILLSAEIENDKAEAVSWLYRFYVANIDTFRLRLNDMINNAVEF